jgi:hypothetical protein
MTRRFLFAAVALLGVGCPAAPLHAQAGASRCTTGAHAEEASGAVLFPQDALFCALLGDPKEARSFVSYLRGEFPTIGDPADADTDIGAVGLGDSFGLVRWNGAVAGDGVQLDLVGSIFAQFDLGTASLDLINADYLIGVPLSVRRRGFTARLRLYHQSSHLGDEYLLRDDVLERENLSFESLELILSQELGALRLYAGGETLFRREPDTLGEQLAHAGIELRSGRAGVARLAAGADLKAARQHDWSPALSARLGIELARGSAAGHPARLIMLLLELYDGPSPYGQFFRDDIRYLGFGAHVSL